MTTEDTPATKFASNLEKRYRLEAILNDPIFIEATDIAEDQIKPQTGTNAEAVPAIAAAKFHQVAGINDFMKSLRRLTKEVKKTMGPKMRTLPKSEKDLPEINR